MITRELQDAIRMVQDFPKQGISFCDLTPVFKQPVLVRKMVEALVEPFRNQGITAIAGIESRGFFLAPAMALELNLPFIPIRKPGKLPASTFAQSYQLEYGMDSLEIHTDALSNRDFVMIHDDVLATGGTARAAAQLVEQCGAKVAGFTFIIELLSLNGREKIKTLPTTSLLTF
ncbi:MAG TPA: adenine phosphoribosyltransferase [Luteibaculaceae bacterium]|nr:adenine phosphoribosyltransferase [Luteibaculaceae bacterium]